MARFTDRIEIRIRAGDGGPGAVSFRREKYIPRGGPDGGDGGTGGNVIIQSDRRYYNLSHFFKDRVYRAENGQPGRGQNRHGRDGEDLVIKVPPGTQVLDAGNGELLADLFEEEQAYTAAEGGIGGHGNAFFKSSTHQTPRMSQPGMAGESVTIILNLKLIADVGLVGLPNSGKSTLLAEITNAKPKIGNYPFTTLTPNLGVIQRENGTFYTLADIPGIIEGAHKGHGLGLSFLQHIERVKVIIYCLDAAGEEAEYNLSLLRDELASYNPGLLDKPNCIVLTKIDLVSDEVLEQKMNVFDREDVVPVSSLENRNLDALLQRIDMLLEKSRAA